METANRRPETHLKSILELTRGIIFLGTPHQGSNFAKWAEMLATSIGILKQTNPQMVQVHTYERHTYDRHTYERHARESTPVRGTPVGGTPVRAHL